MTDDTPTGVSSNGDFSMPMLVYIFYFVSFLTGGFFALVGLIVAYVKSEGADAATLSHYRYQKRTFWFGLVMMVIGVPLSFVGVGLLILLFWFVWTLIRCIKGLIAAQEKRAIADPDTLLW